MMKQNMIRQGDVLLIPTLHAITADAKVIARDHDRIVLAYGEVTGHAHAIDDVLADLFEERDGKIYLRVGEAGATLRHEEHASLALDRGTYCIVHQREYSPSEIRRVAD